MRSNVIYSTSINLWYMAIRTLLLMHSEGREPLGLNPTKRRVSHSTPDTGKGSHIVDRRSVHFKGHSLSVPLQPSAPNFCHAR